MKIKKESTQKKEVENKGSYTTFFDQSESVFIVRESNLNHGSWNYSDNTNSESEDENRIKHETVNFTF